MDGELLALQWMEHSRIFSHAIGNLRGKAAYTDATLACEGKFFTVHKFVLSTCSEYFNAIFEWTPCVNPVVVINNITCKELEALLDFMYIGEVSVRESQIPGVMRAAECLRIRGLAMVDEEGLKTHLSNKNPSEFEGPAAKKRKRQDSRKNTPTTSQVHLPPPPLPPPPVPRPATATTVVATTSTHHFPTEQPLQPVVETHLQGAHPQQQHQPQPSASPRTPQSEPQLTPGPHHHVPHPHHHQTQQHQSPVQATVVQNSLVGTVHTVQSPLNPQAPHTPQAAHTSQPSISQAAHPQHLTQVYTTPSHQPAAGGVPAQTSSATQISVPAHVSAAGSETIQVNEVTIPQPLIPIEKFIQAVKLEIDTTKEGLETQQEDGSVGIPDLLDSLVDMRQIYDTKAEPEEMGTSHNSEASENLYDFTEEYPETSASSRSDAQLPRQNQPAASAQPKEEKNNVGKYKCHYCNRVCQKKESLTRHMHTHTKQPYTCQQCDFTCKTYKNLLQHKKEIHTGLHKCPSCEFTSNRPDNVKRHMTTHSGESPHKCPHCTFSAKRSQYLAKHIKNIHKKKERVKQSPST
ncbi:zinc finger and BTB domain-containing protein 49 isoform X3 [Penaeus vannamei]|nr:zinc finger protein 236-like isoform X3 [Penaeus vannamei]XP_027223148.1 zinc finger protein 236-like isoform X3 [Penaeus vannamei]